MTASPMEWRQEICSVYGDIDISPCPFTAAEIAELDETQEMLVYLPRAWTLRQLCAWANIRTNVDLQHEHLIRNVMTTEDQWFITSGHSSPEMLYKSAAESRRVYEDEGLHGMDFRRYVAFSTAYKAKHGSFPDQRYWVFLLAGSYDRSGVSILGFDEHGVLSHHGWMRNFKAKFVGSRYVVLPPRLEITRETHALRRAYRGRGGESNQESAVAEGQPTRTNRPIYPARDGSEVVRQEPE